jgi:hypothetical protein
LRLNLNQDEVGKYSVEEVALFDVGRQLLPHLPEAFQSVEAMH